MRIVRSSVLAPALAAAVTLSACQPHQDPPPSIRAVKLVTIGAGAPGAARFVATVRQQQRTELAFASGGRIASIAVDVGDRVRKGQVLARLDAEPARLRLQQAQANVAAATAQLRERTIQLRQQQAMFDDGAASQTTLAGAQSAFESARAQLRVAEADRDIAARALRMTELRAPFDGSIAARLAQPDAEVAPGQALLQLDGQDKAQAVAALPPQVAAALKPGAQVVAANGDGTALALRVHGVAERLDNGATVRVLFDLPPTPAAPRSGTSLMLTMPVSAAPALSVPLSAILPATEADTAAVFVYHATTGTVRHHDVRLGAVRGDRAEVQLGLHPGDQVVATGAAFLSDGQKVVPFQSPSRLGDEEQ